MILLDTNVLSEAMRPQPSPTVLAWLDRQPLESLFVSTVTEAEIRYGLARLPQGGRRNRLIESADAMFQDEFAGRILPFDRAAAAAYGKIASERERAGRPISQFDCQIAAIARSRGAAVASRDAEAFEGCGPPVIDPWAR